MIPMEIERALEQQNRIIAKQTEVIQVLIDQVKNLSNMVDKQNDITGLLQKYCDELFGWSKDNTAAIKAILEALREYSSK